MYTRQPAHQRLLALSLSVALTLAMVVGIDHLAHAPQADGPWNVASPVAAAAEKA